MRVTEVLKPGLVLPLLLWLAACGGGANGNSAPVTGDRPVVTSFASSAPATNAGRSVTLSWATQGASRLVLLPGGIDVSARTSYPVTPQSSTIYTLQASNASGSASATTAVRVYDWTQTGTALDAFVASSGTNTVTGYGFILFDRLGTLYTRYGGVQNDSTVLALASATKLPSVAAILTLVDAGLLDLDTPVASYFAARDPSFVWPADKLSITTRMLLAHTSGIVGLNDTQPACLNQPTVTLKSCAQDVANTALVATPGSTFNYGGADFQVAGYLASLLTGQGWNELFAARIGTPVGMPSFTYGTGTNPRIAGGASSNAADYAAFLRMIQNGGIVGTTRVLSAAMITELKKNQINGLPVAYTPFPAGRAANYPGYGLGVFISSPSLYTGSVGPEFSDPGLFGTAPWLDDGLGYGAVLLISQTLATGLDMWDAARPRIISQYTGR